MKIKYNHLPNIPLFFRQQEYLNTIFHSNNIPLILYSSEPPTKHVNMVSPIVQVFHKNNTNNCPQYCILHDTKFLYEGLRL